MSSSESINAIIMMESVALNESHVIENFDFVLVEPENIDDNMGVDEDSYDYCDDAISMLSVENPSSLSVCSDLPSVDPAFFEVDTNKELKTKRRPRLISFGNDEDEARIRSERFQASIENLDEQMAQEGTSEESTVSSMAESNDEKTAVEPQNNEPIVEDQVPDKPMDTDQVPDKIMDMVGSRISNKKRRKKMKLIKKAAAAAAAAAAISTSIVPSPPRERRVKTPKATRPKKKTSNIAVACASETLEAYRAELEAKKKGMSKFVSPV
jgi:hypothetical protein